MAFRSVTGSGRCPDGLLNRSSQPQARSICQMRSSHTAAAVSAVFDDENLIGYGGLEPLVRLAERCALPDLVDQRVRITGAANSGGANPAAKVMSLVAGMCAGADSID